MINFEKPFNVQEYIEIFLRRIWYIIIPLVLAVGAAGVYAKISPRTYLASTTILVTPQKVPTDYVRPTVTSRIEDRLHSISQEIMSRPRLETIISEFNLFPNEAKTLASEQIIERMRKNIIVKIAAREGYFTLSYQGRDPVIVAKVTSRLASLFVEENLKLREQQAQGTTEFLAQELNATKAKLEEQEKILTNFKQKHLYELPDRVVTNLGVLNQLRQDHQRVSEALNSALERKLVIQRQIAQIKSAFAPALTAEVTNGRTLPQDTEPVETSAPPGPANSSTEKVNPAAVRMQIERLRNQVMELQVKYTGKHPDILIAQKAIKELEKVAADAEKESAASVGSGPSEDFDPQAVFIDEMKGQLVATEREIQNLKDEESKIRANIVGYQNRVENAPLRELMMTNLSRDYETTKETYRKLLEKSEQAQQAENLERRQKGEQFQLIDPARVPEKPFKPNVPKILFLGLLLGMGSGFGLAFLREQMDHSFRDAEDLEATLGFKVLTNIPRIEKKAA